MKISPRDSEHFLDSFPVEEIFALLLYGPDEGLIAHRARKVWRQVVDDLDDPFLVQDFDPLHQAPLDLSRALQAFTYNGKKSLIRIRRADDTLTPVFDALFHDPKPCGVVVVQSGDLSPRSSLRRLFEARPQGVAALGCYNPSGASFDNVLRHLAQQQNITLETPALSFLASCFQSHYGLAATEIEKLATFIAPRTQATLADVQTLNADPQDISLQDLILTVAHGTLPRAIPPAAEPIAILRLGQKHFQKLHTVLIRQANGVPLKKAIDSLSPPIFFKHRSRFETQTRLWSLETLELAMKRLIETEIMCKMTSSAPTREVALMALFEVTKLLPSK